MIDEKKLAALQYNSDVLGAIGRAFAEASEGVPGDQLDDCVRALIG